MDTADRRSLHRLEGIRLDRLTSFLAVVDHGGFSAAAQAIGQAQPTISRRVAELERSLGVVLFTRLARTIELTDDGALLLDHARAAIEQLELAIEHFDNSAATVTGTVVVGMYPSAAAVLHPRLLTAMTRDFPAVVVQLWEGAPHEIGEALSAGTIDLAVRPNLPAPVGADLHQSTLWHEGLVVVVRTDDRLAAAAGPISLTDLADRPIVTIGGTASRAGHVAETTRALDGAGISDRVVLRTDAPQMVAAMVAHGHGVGVINALAMQIAGHDDLTVVPVHDTEGGRDVSLWWRGHHRRLRRPVRATAGSITQLACEVAATTGTV